MLCFDIETTGLDPKTCSITVVCTEDFATGKQTAYEFARCTEEHGDLVAMRRELITAFNQARSLCAFNGVRFDIPFLAVALQLDDETQIAWILKTSDILEQSRLRFNNTFSLNMLCEHNGIAVKSADGKQAIRMAAEKRYDDLRLYCAQDVSILCDLYRKQHLIHPRTQKRFDLEVWTREGLYVEEPRFLYHLRQDPAYNKPNTAEHLCEQIATMFREFPTVQVDSKLDLLKDRIFVPEVDSWDYIDNFVSTEFSNFHSIP